LELINPQYDYRKWLNGGSWVILAHWYEYGEAKNDPDFRPPGEARPIDKLSRKSDAELTTVIRVCNETKRDLHEHFVQACEDRYRAEQELEQRKNIRLARQHLRNCMIDPLVAPGRGPQRTLWRVHPTVWRHCNRVHGRTDRKLFERACWFLGQHRLLHRPVPRSDDYDYLPIVRIDDPWFSGPTLPLRNPTKGQMRRLWAMLIETRQREGAKAVAALYREYLVEESAIPDAVFEASVG
jgi:hypothetical protein